MEACEYKPVTSSEEEPCVLKFRWKILLRQLLICFPVWNNFFTMGMIFGAPTVVIPQIRAANITLSDDMASLMLKGTSVTRDASLKISAGSILWPYAEGGPFTRTTYNALLFEDNAELLHFFENFRELGTKQDLAMSAELLEHATKVMNTLDGGIKSMADVDTFFTYVRHVGATHHQVPGFKAENFWKIEQPFLEAAKSTLGDRYTENIEHIYKLTIKFILENLVIGFEEKNESVEVLSNVKQ